MSHAQTLLIADLRDRYRDGRDTPRAVMQRLLAAPAGDPRRVWITRLTEAQVHAYVDALDPAALDSLPLYGIPFVIKDNIDLAGVPTTAACPDYAYVPARSATVVQKLIDAGAIPLGKTNLDQFATGLVGTRSPYGACRNSLNADFISGGSSAGSAVAVATGLASFALGTDTAGSGRVPAGFNNIVGLKPSNGRLSTTGVVPACRSLDCVSIFALTAEDAAAVLAVAEGDDPTDPYSRLPGRASLRGLRFGVPRGAQRQFFGDADYERLFDAARRTFESVGGTAVEVDLEPFLEAARLLYEGPWIAERYAAIGDFLQSHPEVLHPVTRTVIEAGRKPSGVDVFRGTYKLQALKRASAGVWSQVDLLLTPTTGTIYTVDEVEQDPLRLNANLGYYTNFMNLFDLCGVAVPAGFRRDGLPFGVTLVGPRGSDRALLETADRLHRGFDIPLGALDLKMPPRASQRAASAPDHLTVAVCGAHMEGLPLNHQLRERNGFLLDVVRTAPHYRFYALSGGPPRRPGLVRVGDNGHAIEMELWALPLAEIGSFLAGIPAPLALGRVETDAGGWVTGFLCEAWAVEGAADITSYGGWRAYLKAASL